MAFSDDPILNLAELAKIVERRLREEGLDLRPMTFEEIQELMDKIIAEELKKREEYGSGRHQS